MLGARPGPAQPLISSLLAMPFAPPQTPSRGAGSYMGGYLPKQLPDISVRSAASGARKQTGRYRPTSITPDRVHE